MVANKVIVNDKYQVDYTYELTESIGMNFDETFNPELTPAEMLELGVFGGAYFVNTGDEFPKEWFKNAKLSTGIQDPELNFFGVNASQSIEVWREKGWINEEHDPRGWFQWYCRYFMGRRLYPEDQRQIRRWRAMKRHVSQVANNCTRGDWDCRRKQRQALLHWAYDSRKF
jgi:hypothetical protein